MNSNFELTDDQNGKIKEYFKKGLENTLRKQKRYFRTYSSLKGIIKEYVKMV